MGISHYHNVWFENVPALYKLSHRFICLMLVFHFLIENRLNNEANSTMWMVSDSAHESAKDLVLDLEDYAFVKVR